MEKQISPSDLREENNEWRVEARVEALFNVTDNSDEKFILRIAKGHVDEDARLMEAILAFAHVTKGRLYARDLRTTCS